MAIDLFFVCVQTVHVLLQEDVPSKRAGFWKGGFSLQSLDCMEPLVLHHRPARHGVKSAIQEGVSFLVSREVIGAALGGFQVTNCDGLPLSSVKSVFWSHLEDGTFSPPVSTTDCL